MYLTSLNKPQMIKEDFPEAVISWLKAEGMDWENWGG